MGAIGLVLRDVPGASPNGRTRMEDCEPHPLSELVKQRRVLLIDQVFNGYGIPISLDIVP